MEERNIPLAALVLNAGQIDGLPANPRFIRDDKFEALKKSLRDDPEMFELRELIVFPFKDTFVVIAGNMRYRAAVELGLETAPCKVLGPDTPVEKLRAITIKDNVGYGEWDVSLLTDEWDYGQLEEWGLDDIWQDVAKEPDGGLEIDSDLGTSTGCRYMKIGNRKIPITEQEEADLQSICDQYAQEFGTNLGFATKIVEKWRK